MKTFKIFVSLIIILTQFACNQKTDKQNKLSDLTVFNTIKSMNEPDRPIRELKYLALENGDTNAYEILDIAYLDYSPGSFLQIALKMANKYDYPKAYFDVYLAILDFNEVFSPEDTLDKLDIKSRDLAIEYLILGAQKGHRQSLETLTEYLLTKETKNRELILTNKIINNYGDYLNAIIVKNKNKNDLPTQPIAHWALGGKRAD